MSDQINNTFVAVAWPYVNGDIHVGHLAGYLIPCDIFARYSRLKGRKTLMVSGTDCHGTPITVEADKRKISPQELIEIYTPKVHNLISLYNVSYDLFTSTTTDNHKEVTKDVFINLLNNGYILTKISKQYYSEEDNKFLPDRNVEGECPYCHAKDQRSDQCEVCGRTIGFGEIIDPKSKLTGSPVTYKDSEHYFIDLPKLQSKIQEFVDKSEDWRGWVYKETQGWLKEGLEPRAITRDMDWGVEIPVDRVPTDKLIDNAQNKRFYVWFDAVIGYLSAAIEYSNTNPDTDWKDYWFNKDTKHYYFMGKDNLVFHTILWPSYLIGQEKGYNLPYFPSVNQNLNLEGKKFSKSRGIYIDAYRVGEFFGSDKVRFYISSIMPESKDANWKWYDFKSSINSELVANIGNFIHRTLVFFNNKLEGQISATNAILDGNIKENSEKVFTEVSTFLERCEFTNALNSILKYSQTGNQYFDQQKPWAQIKEKRADCEKTLYNCLQIVEVLSKLLDPFMPGSSTKLRTMLGLDGLNSGKNLEQDIFKFVELELQNLNVTKSPEVLFAKVEDEQIEEFTSAV